MATSSDQKVALITGSTSGIGLETAKVLASKGYDIVVNGFGSPEVIEAVVKECQSRGAGRVEYHGADLSKPDQIGEMFRFILERFGHSPDVLVNNAGIWHVAPLEQYSADKWDQIIAINLTAAFHTMKLAVPGMKERGWGRIVNISSSLGLVARTGLAAYVASKFGLTGLTKVVALETAGTGVTCNAICPGMVLTPPTMSDLEAIAEKRGISFEDAKSALAGEIHPSKQLVMPEEVAAMVAYLCSDDARQVTGSSLSIDGGWTAQ